MHFASTLNVCGSFPTVLSYLTKFRRSTRVSVLKNSCSFRGRDSSTRQNNLVACVALSVATQFRLGPLGVLPSEQVLGSQINLKRPGE